MIYGMDTSMVSISSLLNIYIFLLDSGLVGLTSEASWARLGRCFSGWAAW